MELDGKSLPGLRPRVHRQLSLNRRLTLNVWKVFPKVSYRSSRMATQWEETDDDGFFLVGRRLFPPLALVPPDIMEGWTGGGLVADMAASWPTVSIPPGIPG